MTKVIGIDASRAFLNQRTGIEEYSFQVIKNLSDDLKDSPVVLYVRSGQSAALAEFTLPMEWKIKEIKWPFLWTQLGLSLEMWMNPVDVLFVPSHVVPFVHPKKTVVTVHGLECEFFPGGYSLWERLYMRWSIKASCRWAQKIVAVSENTKKDLVNFYKVPAEKVSVIYEGVISENTSRKEQVTNKTQSEKKTKPCLLFIGRLEARKNIIGIIKAFEILKEKYRIPHQLILAGKFGYGKEEIKKHLSDSTYGSDISCPGFVSGKEKQELLRGADVFLFPSFYEGFGLPILEAQNAGVPVVTSDVSSMPKIAGNSALLIDPYKPEQIAEAVSGLISDKALRDGIIGKGHENVCRFSWDKCSSSIALLLKP